MKPLLYFKHTRPWWGVKGIFPLLLSHFVLLKVLALIYHTIYTQTKMVLLKGKNKNVQVAPNMFHIAQLLNYV
jgi:hypothetical protein